MKAIWKYAINPLTTISIPEGARLLSVETQDNQPQLWALVDPTKAKEQRTFRAVATGQDFEEEGHVYVGTVHINHGSLVFHIFETTLPR